MASPAPQAPIFRLPNELFLQIAALLSDKALSNFSLANTQARNILTHDLYKRCFSTRLYEGYEALSFAARHGKIEVARNLFTNYNVNVDLISPTEGRKNMISECLEVALERMRELEGGDVPWDVPDMRKRISIIDNHHLTPLHVACIYGQHEMAGFLLTQGANIEATTNSFDDSDNMPIGMDLREYPGKEDRFYFCARPLHLAARSGNVELLNVLVKHHVDLGSTVEVYQRHDSLAHGNHWDHQPTRQAIHIAAAMGKTEFVIGLLEAGVGVDTLDELNTTPLLCALTTTKFNNISTRRVLLAAGSDITKHSANMFSPLALVSMLGNIDQLEMMLEYQPNLGKRIEKSDSSGGGKKSFFGFVRKMKGESSRAGAAVVDIEMDMTLTMALRTTAQAYTTYRGDDEEFVRKGVKKCMKKLIKLGAHLELAIDSCKRAGLAEPLAVLKDLRSGPLRRLTGLV